VACASFDQLVPRSLLREDLLAVALKILSALRINPFAVALEPRASRPPALH
jgi:hypothetical protein